MSKLYTTTISEIIVADVDANGDAEIYVALLNGTVEVYDAVSRMLTRTLTTNTPNLAALVVADVDQDGAQEIVVVAANRIAVFNAASAALEWQTASYGGTDLEIANVDNDAAPEIVTTRYVLDGITHALEWDYADTFGARVQLADIDQGRGIRASPLCCPSLAGQESYRRTQWMMACAPASTIRAALAVIAANLEPMTLRFLAERIDRMCGTLTRCKR